ncbi:MAG: helix-turn-helix transcriptional regulator [Clostridia bacterium]|nr:helix-turn-helix transcriptional regulator [Clostridia bacterium]
MELEKVGNFIRDKRKEKNLTQLGLAEKIFVSEKTISKWETGKGFPDTSLIVPLCEVLEISANELLSGEEIKDDKTYKEKAEKNLIELKDEQAKINKHLLNMEYFIIISSIIVLLTCAILASYLNIQNYLRIIILAIGFINVVVMFIVSVIIETKVGFYQCGKCGHKYIPTYAQSINSMHMGRTKYMKCPKCHKRSWNKKVID